MKIVKLLIFVFIAVFFFSVGIKNSAIATFAPWRPLCVGIQGKFIATNWKGGAIQVGCVGDDGGATNIQSQKCTGEVQTVKPGKTFRLTKCSCWGSNKGCLKVGKKLRLNPLNSNNRKTITVVKSIKSRVAFTNNQCTINNVSNFCAANGAHLKGKNVVISCKAPSPTPFATLTPTLTPAKSPTPSVCVGPSKVTNVKVSCPNCFSQQDN